MEKVDLLSSPLEVAVELLSFCNLHCKYCFSRKEGRDVIIPYEKLLEILKELRKLKVFSIAISGGEPFLHPNIMQILKTACDMGFSVNIVTNGTLIDSQIVRELKSMGLIGALQVSLDSHLAGIHNKVRGAYDKTIKALNLFRDLSDERPSIGTVVHKLNHSSYIDMVDYLVENDLAHRFHIMMLMPTPAAMEQHRLLYLSIEEINEFWQHIRDYSIQKSSRADFSFVYKNLYKGQERANLPGCLAGKTLLVIDSHLNVFPCDIVRKPIGNLNNSTIEEIWNSKLRLKLAIRTTPLCENMLSTWHEK